MRSVMVSDDDVKELMFVAHAGYVAALGYENMINLCFCFYVFFFVWVCIPFEYVKVCRI